MKKFLIPLSKTTCANVKLPVVLYSQNSATITLEPLSRSDIKETFGLEITDDPSDPTRHTTTFKQGFAPIDPMLAHDLADSHLKVIIDDTSSSDINQLRDKVVFAIRLVAGQSCSLTAVRDDYLCKNNWGWHHIARVFSVTPVNELNNEHICEIKSIVSHNPTPELEQKMKTLKALLESAMSQPGAADVSCVLYISVLEAIYLQKEQELTYKLAMRITRKLGEDYKFFIKINKLYEKRGRVIHGTEKGAVFSPDDHNLLRYLARKSFIDYLADPGSFSQRKLDKMLLA